MMFQLVNWQNSISFRNQNKKFMSQIILTAFTLILLTQICYSQDANALIRAKFNENIDHIDYVFIPLISKWVYILERSMENFIC